MKGLILLTAALTIGISAGTADARDRWVVLYGKLQPGISHIEKRLATGSDDESASQDLVNSMRQRGFSLVAASYIHPIPRSGKRQASYVFSNDPRRGAVDISDRRQFLVSFIDDFEQVEFRNHKPVTLQSVVRVGRFFITTTKKTNVEQNRWGQYFAYYRNTAHMQRELAGESYALRELTWGGRGWLAFFDAQLKGNTKVIRRKSLDELLGSISGYVVDIAHNGYWAAVVSDNPADERKYKVFRSFSAFQKDGTLAPAKYETVKVVSGFNKLATDICPGCPDNY